MKFTAAAVLAAATGAVAHGHNNVTVVTEVVESYVTYCPAPTTISHGTNTWTVTEPTTLTITDCPCTITKPVTTTTATVCNTCPPSAPGYTNSTAPGVPPTVPGVPPPTGGVPVPTNTEPAPTSVPTAGAIKAGLSGVAGAVGLAAFFL